MKSNIVSFITLAIIVAMFLGGCSLSVSDEPKTFSSKGLTLTLTEGFWEANYEPFTVCYDSNNMAVFALEETFDMFEAAGYSEMPTLEEYAELVAYANEVPASSVFSEDGLIGFSFSNIVAGEDYTYFAYTYKGSESFWLVQFAVFTEDAAEMQDKVVEFAKSVSVD